MRLSSVVGAVLLLGSPAIAEPPPAPDPYAAQSRHERTIAYQRERGDYDMQVRVLNFAVGCRVIGADEAGPPVAAAGAALAREGRRLGIADTIDALTSAAAQAGRQRATQPNACHYWHDHPDAVAFVQAQLARPTK